MANQEQISLYHLNVIPQFLRTLVVEGLWGRMWGEVEGRVKTHFSFTKEERRNAVSVRGSIIPTAGHSHVPNAQGNCRLLEMPCITSPKAYLQKILNYTNSYWSVSHILYSTYLKGQLEIIFWNWILQLVLSFTFNLVIQTIIMKQSYSWETQLNRQAKPWFGRHSHSWKWYKTEKTSKAQMGKKKEAQIVTFTLRSLTIQC